MEDEVKIPTKEDRNCWVCGSEESKKHHKHGIICNACEVKLDNGVPWRVAMKEAMEKG